MNLRRKKILAAVATIWAIGMIAFIPDFVAVHRETKSAFLTFDQYAGSLVSRNYRAAYALCGTEFQNATPFGVYEGTYQGLADRLGKLQSVQRGAYEVKGRGSPATWTATIETSFICEKQTLRFRLALRKNGGRWLVYGAEEM